MEPAFPTTLLPVATELRDAHGRVARDLRISLTDRCNLRCGYCMPPEGLPWQEPEEHLSAEEILRVVRILASRGVRAVRLTGGEPLLRRDLDVLVAELWAITGIEDVSLTTNGVLLDRWVDRLVAAGGVRLNVSLDAADAETFARVTRRDVLPRVLHGLTLAAREPRLRPLKLNAVAMPEVTPAALPRLLALARAAGAELRFIEPMPLDAQRDWTPQAVLSASELRELLSRHGELRPVASGPSSTARRYELGSTGQIVGLISPVTEPFCGACDRLRLTADGHLRSCLFSDRELALRGPLRDAATDDELGSLMAQEVWQKPSGHGITAPQFVAPQRPMSAIGG